MHGSSTVLPSKVQQELSEHNDIVGPQGLDALQRLINTQKSVQLGGAGDSAAVSRNVASPCSIESAIDSVISQARAEGETIPNVLETLPPELLQSVNAIKEVVCLLHNKCYLSFLSACNSWFKIVLCPVKRRKISFAGYLKYDV